MVITMSEVYNSIYFVTGGGTGGHIYPAMAVADTLTESGAKVFYVGNKRNMEFELASKKGYKFLHVSVSGMPRKLNPKFFVWGVKLVKAILRSVRYIKKYKPNAVFATGGYVGRAGYSNEGSGQNLAMSTNNNFNMSIQAMDAESFMTMLQRGGGDVIRQYIFDNNRNFASEAGVW